MRPGQQNKRGRGRNNNGGGGGVNNNFNRKGQNPLTRTYDSSGPDIKIRGTAQHIAEKYATLARDAQSAGDRVMAENYLQHAEHYNRIIAAAQAQMPIQNVQNLQAGRDLSDDDMDEDRDEYESHGGSQGAGAAEQPQPAPGSGAQPVNLGAAPQPVIEGTPAEVALNAEAGEGNRRHERHQQNGAYGNDSEGGHRRGRRPRRGGHRPGLNGETAEAGGAGQPADDAEQPASGADDSDPALLGVDN